MTKDGIKEPPLLTSEEVRRMNAYWRAANYLSVGQIYLYDNPLLRQPLKLEHVKPRLLGHWGTTPGLNFIYVHLNRLIKLHDLNVIYVTGPGHGGPGLVANTYLEGTYSEFYPNISQDEEGMKRLFKQFSFPGGIPSHVATETPGSIHEGGELGYAIVHASCASWIRGSNNNDPDGPQGSEDDDAIHSCHSASEKCAFSEFWSQISHTRDTAANVGSRKLLI